jgi:hypothetical protein
MSSEVATENSVAAACAVFAAPLIDSCIAVTAVAKLARASSAVIALADWMYGVAATCAVLAASLADSCTAAAAVAMLARASSAVIALADWT